MTKHNIKVCMGSSCFARGNLENLNFFGKLYKRKIILMQKSNLSAVCVRKNAHQVQIFYIDDVLYNEINEEKLQEILKTAFSVKFKIRG